MPRAPKRCGRTDCTARVVAATYCPEHQAERDRRINTTARGYGHAHQNAREAALRVLTPGTPCHLCQHPMWPAQRLAFDHTPDRTGYRGLVHARCNSRDGGQRAHH